MEFITDRTIEDVHLAQRFENMNWSDFSDEEKQEWIDGHSNGKGLKGAFNYTDWNRIVNNINTLYCISHGIGVKIFNAREDVYSTINFSAKKVLIYNPALFNVTVIPFKDGGTVPDTSGIKTFTDEVNIYEDTSEDGYDHIYFSMSGAKNKNEIINTRVVIVDAVTGLNFTEPIKNERDVFKKTDFQELENHSLTLSYRHPCFMNDVDSTINTSYEFINKIESRVCEVFKYINQNEMYYPPIEWQTNKTIDEKGQEIDTDEDRYLAKGFFANFFEPIDNKATTIIKVPKGTIVRIHTYAGRQNVSNYTGYDEYVAQTKELSVDYSLGIYLKIEILGTVGEVYTKPKAIYKE